MRCRWGLVPALCLASGLAQAQPADGAMPGGLHVAAAETLPAGAADVELLSGFGYRKGLLASNHRFGRGTGDVSAAYGLLPELTLGLSLDGYYDRHFGFPSGGSSGCGATCDDGYVGNPHLYARFAKMMGKHAIGAQLGVWVPGNKAPSVRFGATSVDALLLASLAVGPGTLSVNAGFRLDNSIESVDDLTRLSLQDRISLGVSNYNEVLAGAQLVVPVGHAGNAWVGVEGSLEAFVGGEKKAAGATLREGSLLLRAGVTAGLHLGPQWAVVAYLEGAKVPGVLASQAMAGAIPIVPYEPLIGGGLALEARFGGPHGGVAGPPPCWQTAEGCQPDEKPLFGDVTGSVVDENGKPLVGVKVTVKGHTYGETQTDTTKSDGTFHVANVKVGRRVTTPGKNGPTTDEKIDETSLDVSAELGDRKPGTATVDQPKAGPNQVAPITLAPALPPGQLKGLVRTQAGKPIGGATITVEPGDKKTDSAADGTFAIDLVPGQYKVTVKAPGLEAQELDVTIDPNGVALKEFVLHR